MAGLCRPAGHVAGAEVAGIELRAGGLGEAVDAVAGRAGAIGRR